MTYVPIDYLWYSRVGNRTLVSPQFQQHMHGNICGLRSYNDKLYPLYMSSEPSSLPICESEMTKDIIALRGVCTYTFGTIPPDVPMCIVFGIAHNWPIAYA